MYDTAVSSVPGAGNSPAITQRRVHSRAADRTNDDDLLARVLITSWTLVTGRTLPAGVVPQSLTENELITFWADDQMTVESEAGPGPTAASRAAASPVPATDAQ